MRKTPSMADLLKSVRRPLKESNYNVNENATESEIVYDLIGEVVELRDSVGSSLNTIDEMLAILKDKLPKNPMFIDNNPYDEIEYDMFGKRKKKDKINPMNIQANGGLTNKHHKDKKSSVLNAKL